MQEINIDLVANILGIVPFKESNGEYYAKCPFCGDNRGKFSYTVIKKNKYHCWKCGNSGNQFKLYSELKNLDLNLEDSREFKKCVNLIHQELNGKTQPFKYETSFIGNSVKQSNRACDEKLNIAYKALLSQLQLNKYHKDNLLKRGLSEKHIAEIGFKTIQGNGDLLAKKMLLQKIDLNGVPGFFKENNSWKLKYSKGYLCPVYRDHMIIGFQIRVDEPKDGRKYLWLSSAGKENGCTSGGRFTYLKGKKNITLITEGILKATICYELLDKQFSVIGVPGVDVLNDFKENGIGLIKNDFVFECYDMDKKPYSGYNEKTLKKVQSAQHKLHNILEKSNIKYTSLVWDFSSGIWKGNYKGLDDYLSEKNNIQTVIDYINNYTKNVSNNK
ncbi:CHC2 zinc finger domain-containing protein [Lachnospira multipara]|uniref:CHC2 zinc finger n=1 Tax=Lachnospira multipara TaxID=28051 RepID=A0A1H5VVS1_9FIRM|nr:CHC2 zinc finger domain-containing protein [Lachnospira multipara]SEF91300.1 protein of unknown function [Lachnospira multipara]